MANDHSFLLVEFATLLAANLTKALKPFSFRGQTILQEKGSSYQAMKTTVNLILDLAKSPAFASQPDLKALENEVLNSPIFKEVVN
jgi:hypothetical protein